MKLKVLACVTALSAFLSSTAAQTPVKHRILLAQYQGTNGNRLIEVSPEGKLVWEHQPPSLVVGFEVLPNGNILYAYGGNPTGAQEIDRQHKVLWNYVSKCPQTLACERLANGNTLIGEQGPSQAVEVTPDGRVVSTVALPTNEKPFHRQVRHVHRLTNGHVLAAMEADGAAEEVDATGKIVWVYTGLDGTFEALRLPNGNTLIAAGTQRRVVEVTSGGKIAWELTAKDLPDDLNLTWITSLQVLRNGNLVVGNFVRGQEGHGAHAFEVTRDKRVVWKFADHEMVKSMTMVRVLDDE
jgi:outer membrane protein assembly factor BamB